MFQCQKAEHNTSHIAHKQRMMPWPKSRWGLNTAWC